VEYSLLNIKIRVHKIFTYQVDLFIKVKYFANKSTSSGKKAGG